MTRRSLSKREGDLILALEWEKRRLVTIQEIIRRLRCSPAYARYLAHTLQKKGWLAPLGRGHYQLIGAERGPKGVPEMNPYLVARLFPKPYFFAYRFACLRHGLITQIPSLIHVAVARPKRPVELKNVRFEFVVLSRKRFFGIQEAIELGETIKISDLERTLLDAFDRPDLVGGLEAAVQALHDAGKKADYAKLLDYLQRFNDGGLARRFGYVADQLGLQFSTPLAAYLRSRVKKDPAFLGSPKRWGADGKRNRTWNLIVNVPREDLFGEVRIG
ncbi:MAG: type IV toxin-antitoxin system AbiEi family antitoxin domain-containing protein [Planctomycetes bacterium]|nr:type IV toxin-antitoxin system AbiEi family antitoxin domain-containing protein [Planctomycetota bacterium]